MHSWKSLRYTGLNDGRANRMGQCLNFLCSTIIWRSIMYVCLLLLRWNNETIENNAQCAVDLWTMSHFLIVTNKWNTFCMFIVPYWLDILSSDIINIPRYDGVLFIWCGSTVRKKTKWISTLHNSFDLLLNVCKEKLIKFISIDEIWKLSNNYE